MAKAYAIFPYPQKLSQNGELLPGCVVDVGDVGTWNTVEEARAILATLNGDWEHPIPGRIVRPGCYVEGARYVNLIKA